MIASAVMDFPEPDSPAMARVSPRWSWNVRIRDERAKTSLGVDGHGEALDAQHRLWRKVGCGCLGPRRRGHSKTQRGK